MRRKEANSGMKILGRRVMSPLQVWLWLLLFIFQNEFCIAESAEPGYLDFDNLPETNFSCTGKVIGGYYADLETDCQMFHVCTIGQLEEPMDIKFLCLNGTVFDQETRVCERVDEVDCSKSEHFYSLNLELYGNTAPPIIKADTSSHRDTDEDEEEEDGEYEEVYDETSTTPKSTTIATTVTTTTKRPITTTTPRVYHTTLKTTYYHTTVQSYRDSSDTEDDAYDLIDDNDNNDSPKTNGTANSGHHYQHYNTDSQLQRPQPDSGGQKNKYKDYDVHSAEEGDSKSTSVDDNSQLFSPQDFIYHHNKQSDASRKTPAISFQQQSFSSDGQNSHVTVTTHTGHGTYNADGLKSTNNANDNSPINRAYLTSSTPQSDTKKYVEKSPTFNTYQSFNSPKRTPLVPTPNTQGNVPTGHRGISSPKQQNEPLYFSFRKPQAPQGFKSSQSSSLSPNQNQKQISKVPAKSFQSYQPSERHEISIESEYDFEKLTPTYPFIHQDFSQYHYEHKRSQEADKYEDKSISEKSTETTTITSTPYYNTWATRNNNYTKSLPRVIVTASASVSDSNGKKLNYTVGNLVHAVKPLVPTNYDNYKESDVLLDPFFLDVPKLARNRSKRSSKNDLKGRISRQAVFKAYIERNRLNKTTSTTALSTDLEDPISIDLTPTNTPHISELIKDKRHNITKDITTVTTPWVPPDYVDDNYEPLVYQNNDDKNNENPKDSNVDESNEKTKVKPFLGFRVLGVSTNNKSKPQNKMNTVHITQYPVSVMETQSLNKTQNILNVTEITAIDGTVKENAFEFTTEFNSAKTTLDVATLESTTVSFVDSKIKSNNSSRDLKKYNLTSVNLVTMSEKNTTSVKFSCKGKKYYKFYPDKTDCRTFHFCSPGFSPRQVLDMVFSCDLGTFFNHSIVSCTREKPNDCEN